jgi:pre-peptidase
VTGLVAHVPDGLDARTPLNLVLFFHGSGMCALQLAMNGDVVCKPGVHPDIGGGLAARHDDAGTQSIFAVPQFALWGGGTSGRMAERGYFRSFVSELVDSSFAPGLGGPRSLDDVGTITLVAHSAGHIPLLSILERGDLDDRVRNVVLIDALYDTGADTLLRWLARGRPDAPRKLVSVHGTWGGQAARGRFIAERWARTHPGSVAIEPDGSFEEAIRSHDVTIKTWPVEHAWMLLLMFTKTIAGLDLPRRPVVPTRAPVAAAAVRPAVPLDLAGRSETGAAGHLDVGDTLLENGAFADDYALPVAAGKRIAVDVEGGPSDTEWGNLDTYVQVLDGAHVLGEDDDSRGFFDPHLEIAPPKGGVLTIRVTTQGSGAKRGPYRLTIRALN